MEFEPSVDVISLQDVEDFVKGGKDEAANIAMCLLVLKFHTLNGRRFGVTV